MKRYELRLIEDDVWRQDMCEDEEGEYVLYEDVEVLQKRIADLEAEIAYLAKTLTPNPPSA